MTRILLWLVLALIAIVVLAGAALQSVWLRDGVLRLGLDATVDAWSVEGVQGSLLTGIIVQGLRLEVDGIEVSIERIEGRPALGRILIGQAALRTLLLDRVQIALPAAAAPSDPSPAPYRGFRLPVAVAVDLLDLRALDVDQGDLQYVSRLDLSGRLSGRDQRLGLEEARLYWPDQGLLLRGEANLGLDARLPFRVHVEGTREDPAGAAPMQGVRAQLVGALAGAGRRVELDADLHGGVTGRVEAALGLDDGAGRARVRLSALDWPGVPAALALRDLDLDASGTLATLSWALLSEADWSGQAFAIDARGTLAAAQLEVVEAALTSFGSRIELAGSLALDGPRNYTARFTASDLDLSPWAPDWPSRLDAAGSLAGSLGSDPAAELEVSAAALKLSGMLRDRPIEAQLEASLDLMGLELSRAQLSLDDNHLDLAGSISRDAPWDFEATIQGRELDLSNIVPGWPTRLGLETHLAGRLRAADRRLDVHALRVDGQWNAVPAQLRARDLHLSGVLPDADTWQMGAPLEGMELAIGQLELVLGRNRLEASARIDGTLAGRLTAELPALSQFWPGLQGAAAGTVNARGSAAAPILDVDVALDRIALAGQQLQRARVSGRASADEAVATALEFDVGELIVGDLQIDGRGELTGRWPLLTAAGVLEVPAAELTAELAVTANLAGPGQATLERLQLDQPLAGSWRLDVPVVIDPVAAPGALATLTAACLRAAEPTTALCWSPGRVVVDDAEGAVGLEIDLALEALRFTALAPFIPPALELDGVIAGEARIRGADVDVRLCSDDTLILIMDHVNAEAVFDDRLERFVVEFSRRGAVITGRVDAHATTAGSMRLEAQAQLDPALVANDLPAALTGAEIDVNLSVDVADLTPFGPLVPGLERTSGSLSGNLRAKGSARAPDLSGQLTLLGAATIPALDLLLEPVTLTLRAEVGQPATLSGELYAGDRKLDVRATADWSATAGLTANGRLSGDAIALSAMPDLNLTLTPDLHFTLDREALRIAGTAVIPEAQARLRALPEGGEVLSRDVVIHRAVGQEIDQPGRDLYMNLDVSLGERVFLSAAAGLDTRLVGRLLLTQSPQQPLSARGSLATRNGQFSIYGQTLELRQGRLNFDGPLENPSVDILAIRRVEEAEVGVRVSGFFDALETRLHSVPQRGETEALTMLITGRMPSEASSADLAQASDAALAFGIGQATPFIGRLVNQLGIDELAVDRPLDEEAGAILIGTRLTEDLYVRYTYGLHSRLGGLQIEYRISDWLSVQSESGVNQAVDLIFRREFR